jgi:hypothetical protein
MNILHIEILNPRATKLLKELAALDLIAIQSNSSSGFSSLLKKLRANSKTAPSLDEITKEVEAVRSKRYAK